MSRLILSDLRSIIDPMKPGDWGNLKTYCVLSLRCLSHVDIDYHFLEGAAKYWDSTDHVFRFDSYEICPFYEEFAAIMDTRCSSADKLAQVKLNSPIPSYLVPSLNLPPQAC